MSFKNGNVYLIEDDFKFILGQDLQPTTLQVKSEDSIPEQYIIFENYNECLIVILLKKFHQTINPTNQRYKLTQL